MIPRQLIACLATALVAADPPPNPAAPASHWSEGHGVYCQQSTSLPGPALGETLAVDLVPIPGDNAGFFPSVLPTGTAFTAPYADGAVVAWGSNGRRVYKAVLTPESTTVIGSDPRALGYGRPYGYWCIDREYRVYVPDYASGEILVFGDAVPGEARSAIALRQRAALPEGALRHGRDFICGIKLLYGGELLVTTRSGWVGVLGSDLVCRAQTRLAGQIENNPAVDETGRFWLTTKTHLHCLRFAATTIEPLWEVAIAGSGSTPTLVGAPGDPDRLIAIGDRRSPMRVVLMWRDEIPADWAGIPGADRRLAGEIPLRFGGDGGEVQPSENSLLVSGYGIALARWNGLYPRWKDPVPGVEKVVWDPRSRSLSSAWVNGVVAMPNSMIALSRTSGLCYGVGVVGTGREAWWSLQALDWETGELVQEQRLGAFADRALNTIGSGIQIGSMHDVVTMSPETLIRVRGIAQRVPTARN